MSASKSFKVVLLGEAGVGKTSIIHQFAYHQFDPDCLASISAQFISKTVEYKGFGPIKFDIWDTAGQERYRSMARIFYKDAKVIIFVYDITNQASFDGIKDYWFEQIKINCEEDAVLALVANKNDLYDEQQVLDESGQIFADDINAIFQSTSAFSDKGIELLFENIGKKLMDPEYDYKDSDKKAKAKYNQKLRSQNKDNSRNNIKLGNLNSDNANKGGCCG